jgi:hypothetical protein
LNGCEIVTTLNVNSLIKMFEDTISSTSLLAHLEIHPPNTKQVLPMKKLLASLCAFAATTSLNAQALNCAALENSMLNEPAGYAAQCRPGLVAAPATANSTNAPTDTGFTIDIRGQAPRLANTLYSFTLNAFATQTTVGVTNPQVFGMDFDAANTTLFGVTGAAATPNPGALGTINRTTGAFTLIAPLTGLTAGDSSSGLSINPRTGTAFLSAAGGTPVSSRLYSLNLTTGAATLIGPITAPTDPTGTIMIDIAMNCSGQLYAHSISDDALYSVNTTTGAGTFIGTHGLAANFAQGMDFDNESGTLYAFIYTGAGTNRFGTFNLATGAFTSLTTDTPLGEFEGAIPTACPALVTPVTPTGTPISLSVPGSRTLSFTGAGSVSCVVSGPFTAAPLTFTSPGSITVTSTGAGTGELVCSSGAVVIARYPLSAALGTTTVQAPAFSAWSLGLMLASFGLLGLLATRRFS